MSHKLFCDFCGTPINGFHRYNITKDERDKHHAYRGKRTEICDDCYDQMKTAVLEIRNRINSYDPSEDTSGGGSSSSGGNCNCQDNVMIEF